MRLELTDGRACVGRLERVEGDGAVVMVSGRRYAVALYQVWAVEEVYEREEAER